MKLLLRVTALGFAIIVLLCVGALVAGKNQPKLGDTDGFETCDGVPCYANIMLNRTTLDEASAIFRNSAAFVPSNDFIGADITDDYFQTVALRPTKSNVIFEIDLFRRDMTHYDERFTVATLLSVLGSLCALY